ncbi:Spy/CpxP family protein refolding chaperone [Larkinella sp. C7]|jgi:protein CpxP|uniref:Spy/CpxP family protein refolding chaperone n=1 Tax=Larkinella sp. C7 TaxID=2576607 RepID=UPI001111307A|nr:periplasmic heavy metal sensor [Larkinella sp. C7]
MERTKLLTFAVAGLILLNLATIGFLVFSPGGGPHSGRPNGPQGREEPARIIIARLRLDPNQQQAYQKLIEEHRKQVNRLTEQMKQLHQRYYGLLAATTSDSARQTVLSQQIADNQKAQAELNFRHFEQIKALCRPDQQADFRALADDLAGLFGRHQPPRPGVGGPPENFPHRP